MANIRRISQIAPTLAFTEFDMIEKYRKSFERSELGHVHASFPFESFAKKMGLKESPIGRTGHFSPSGKIALMVLKSYTGFSDQCLIEHLNGNIHYQLFCGIMIDPSAPITNFKIVSAIRSELSQKMVIEDLQEVLAQAWRPLLCDKRIACPYLRWRSNPSTTCLT